MKDLGVVREEAPLEVVPPPVAHQGAVIWEPTKRKDVFR